MVYLHEDKKEFQTAVRLASKKFLIQPAVAEKDYYVTMILRGLSDRLDFIVFKGGTSLSKCHKVIKRFSEDIDITTDKKLTQGQMRKLKEAIKATAELLGMTIPNLNDTRSCYM
jgi:predicted nucleotidyltransferase component of viral defense system